MHAARTVRRLTAAILVPVALAIWMPSAAAQTPADITGTVTNATVDGPLADAPVEVVFFDAQGQLAKPATTTTDAEGAFSVTPPTGATGYQVVVDHDGAEFRGTATQLLSGQPSLADVSVWNTTNEPGDVVASNEVVWIDEDPQTGGWNVQQDFGWTNDGDTAYVGEDGATLMVPLPEGATNLQFLGTFLEQQGDVVDGAYVSGAPIVPGQTTATIFFTSPQLPVLELPAEFDVEVFQLFVPMGLQPQGTGLRLAGTQSDQGVTYQVYTTDPMPAGTELQVSFLEVDVPEGESDATTYLLIGIAVLALAAAVFFLLRGRRKARPAPTSGPKKARPAQPQNAPKPRPAAQVAASPSNGHRAGRPVVTEGSEDDDEVQLLIDEIAALDLSFEKGLLDERAYRRLRVAAKDRLLLAQEAASGSRSTR
jgi:LPXTG-motif cell wall-anchored protein